MAWMVLFSLCCLATRMVAAYHPPEDTTGPFATGVHDADCVDRTYPSEFSADHHHHHPSEGRRLMFRMWYPTCEKSKVMVMVHTNGTTVATCSSAYEMGERRRYFEPGEFEAYFGGTPEPRVITDSFDRTQSYLDAPPLAATTGGTNRTFPVIIYMHGYGSWVSDNTALLEDIASHGYTVVALASPGFAMGILYPNNSSSSSSSDSRKRVVTAADDYPDIYATITNQSTTLPHPLGGEPYSDDLQVRYDRMKLYLHEGAIPKRYSTRLRDDMLALADYIEEQSTKNSATTRDANNNNNIPGSSSSFSIQEIVGTAGLEHDGVIYMGYSLGGAAAGSAAQKDRRRAAGAINLDGLHQSLDLWGTPVRVPYLTFQNTAELVGGAPWWYFNEFFFESFETMGTAMPNNNVTRVRVAEGVTHQDFSDLRHFDQAIRGGLLNLTTSVDGDNLLAMLSNFCLGFIDKHLGETKGDSSSWVPEDSFRKFQDVKSINVSYVADFWKTRDDSSSSPAAILGWPALSVPFLSILLNLCY